MKRALLFIALFGLLLAACSPAATASVTLTTITSPRIDVPFDPDLDYLTNTPTGANDDVVPAPGLGPQYRGNINAVDPVPVRTEERDGASITWRTSATATPGQAKYNIIKVFPGGMVTGGRLYAENVPDWLTLVYSGGVIGPGNGWGPVLAMDVSAAAPPGQYRFSLGIVVDDGDYGTFSVTLDIVAP